MCHSSRGRLAVDLLGFEIENLFISEHFSWAYEGEGSRDRFHCCSIPKCGNYNKQREEASYVPKSLKTETNTTVETAAQPTPSKINDEEKALKKKLKKEKQKEKKNNAKQAMNKITAESNPTSKKPTSLESNDAKICEPIPTAATPTPTLTIPIITDMQEKENELPADNNNNNNNDNLDTENGEQGDDNDINFLIDAPVVPAFVQSTILGKNNTIKMMKKTDDKNKNKETNYVFGQNIPDDIDGFTSVKKGTKQVPVKFNKTPEGFGIEALKMIKNGIFPMAIHYLSRAIDLDPIDTRHYINRSFCYLRTGDYEKALGDIKFASEHFTDVAELAKAKCREGQAYCGLGNYQAAELAFENCLKLTPKCPYAKRELRRMQVCQMVSMGFNERNAILALQKCLNTADAINLLSTTMSTNESSYDSTESATDDEIYQSDEEEEISNESLLSKTLNYNPELRNESRLPESMATKLSRIQPPQRSESADRELKVIKTITPVVKPDPSINEMAIWVGNLTSHVTDAMLTKRFGKFGKITSIHRPMKQNSPIVYCFINFQTAAASKKALEEASLNGGNIDLDGYLLCLKPATAKS
ncbi:uncharacterized protein [Venturia canescens]|uniref:uncharacterized protein n=1 Tax=Venturia canescens TaxID=32260 RepID=UPI001C9D4A57|nr:uncharacterized protein LOC122408811 [Venturia canescens]